jgi:hypothetical protein
MKEPVNSPLGAADPNEAADALAAALEVRGLVAVIRGHGAVEAVNPAGEPDTDDPRGQVLSPGLRQEVICRCHGDDGALWWFWVWSGPTRESSPELEPLCPITDTPVAADRIARVLTVPFAGCCAESAAGPEGGAR